MLAAAWCCKIEYLWTVAIPMALLQPLATRVKNNHNNHVKKKTPHWKHNSIIYRHNKYMVKIYKHYYHLRREREREKKKARSLPHHLGPNRQPQSRPNPSPAPAASWRSPGVPGATASRTPSKRAWRRCRTACSSGWQGLRPEPPWFQWWNV